MTNGQILLLMLLFTEIGFVVGWLLSEYRHAGRELKRIREQFDDDRRRYNSI